MCGIAGFVLDERCEIHALERCVYSMGAAHQSRGPDQHRVWSDGYAALGCTRLAIVGQTNAAEQPLADPSGTRLVFNGEIYDYRAQLRRLGESESDEATDGRALAACLRRHGPDGLNALHGMFACARYDPATHRVLLARDSVGKKPLYYTRLKAGWAFSSTVAALHSVAGPLELRAAAIDEYLVFRSVGGNHSAFHGVEQLPPGCWMELGSEGYLKTGRWWAPPADCSAPGDALHVRTAIDHAVALRADGNREIGVFLSGGLDSAIVAASLARQRPDQRFRTYSVGYDVGGAEDETALARQVAEHIGRPWEKIVIQSSAIPDLLRDVACLLEDPIQDPVTVPTLALARRAVLDTKVVLTGDGSDEIWGGYERFDAVPHRLDEYLTRTYTFHPREIGSLAQPASYMEGIALPSPHLPPLDGVLRVELANRMRNYHLARLDKLTMGVGLEGRCPFLDIRAVELGLRIPAARKRPGDRPKGLLIDAFQEDLPLWLRMRRKQPFSVPVHAWLKGGLRDYSRDLLAAPQAWVRSFVNPEPYLEGIFAEGPPGAGAASRVWSLLQLEVWYREFAANVGKLCLNSPKMSGTSSLPVGSTTYGIDRTPQESANIC